MILFSLLALTAVGLRKAFGPLAVLDDIDLELPPGSVLSLLGPHGFGKTTTVQIMSTLIPGGMEPVAARTAIRQARPIAMIAQDGDALDWWHRPASAPAPVVRWRRLEVARWHRDNSLNIGKIV